MSAKFATIPAQSLSYGMYVAELDRPWLETPFLVQGFVVSEAEQMKLLQELCRTVTIDTGLSLKGGKLPARVSKQKNALKREMAGKKLEIYQDTRSYDEEIGAASTLYQDYEETVKNLYEGFRSKKTIDIKDINKSVNNLVHSIVRNPDACMMLRQMRRKSDYLHDHAMGMSIWSAALGRQLGLPLKEIKLLAFGAMMADVGTIEISDNLLNKPAKLTDSEFSYVQSHVKKSLQAVAKIEGVGKSILDIVVAHHERYDGSGYPRGLSGTDIPLHARIVAIADCYDAMTTQRPFAVAKSPSEAITVLYELRDSEFQSDLVEEFIQAVGTYPVGTLVELSTGEVGIVISETRRRRLRPKILLLLDRNKKPAQGRNYINLVEQTHDRDGQPVDIARALEPDAYGLGADDIFG